MLEYSKNGQVSEGLSLHSLFSKPTLSLADISEVFCVKCEGRDSPVPPPPAPTESGQLFNTLCPSISAFFFFPISDVRLYTVTQLFPHTAICGCVFFLVFFLVELIHHIT